MKKIFSVVLVLVLLFPILALTVSAAGSDEYIFERFEKPVTYSNFPFSPEGLYFAYEGILPEGTYSILLEYEDIGASISVPGYYTVDYYEEDPFQISKAEMQMNIYVDDILQESFTASLGAIIVFESTCLQLVDMNFPSYITKIILVPIDVVSDSLKNFLMDLSLGFNDFTVPVLVQVFLITFSVVSGLVICWFGYRFISRKILKSFKKGKL